jgi:hypothetical protein
LIEETAVFHLLVQDSVLLRGTSQQSRISCPLAGSPAPGKRWQFSVGKIHSTRMSLPREREVLIGSEYELVCGRESSEEVVLMVEESYVELRTEGAEDH